MRYVWIMKILALFAPLFSFFDFRNSSFDHYSKSSFFSVFVGELLL